MDTREEVLRVSIVYSKQEIEWLEKRIKRLQRQLESELYWLAKREDELKGLSEEVTTC